MTETKPEDVKRMADLLRQGAALTNLSCPACASPLFRLTDGSLLCVKCEKKVIVVKNAEEEAKISSVIALHMLETTLMEKVRGIQDKMQRTEDVEELQKLSSALSELLANLEKIRKMKT
jgi:UPF0148 protein